MFDISLVDLNVRIICAISFLIACTALFGFAAKNFSIETITLIFHSGYIALTKLKGMFPEYQEIFDKISLLIKSNTIQETNNRP